TIYTLNGGYLSPLGGPGTFSLTVDSSAPGVQSPVAAESITFTANLASPTVTPTGTVTFTDLTYNGLTAVTTTLAAGVSVDDASVTTAALQAGGGYLGNHWITAAYSGDSIYPASRITRLQKVHAYSTTTMLTAS